MRFLITAVAAATISTSAFAAPFSVKGFNWAMDLDQTVEVIRSTDGRITSSELEALDMLVKDDPFGPIKMSISWSIGGVYIDTLVLTSKKPFRLEGGGTLNEMDEALKRYTKNFGKPVLFQKTESETTYGRKIPNFTAIWEFSDGSSIAMQRAITTDKGGVMLYSPEATKLRKEHIKASVRRKNADF